MNEPRPTARQRVAKLSERLKAPIVVMNGVFASIKGLSVTLKHLTRKPITIQYPEQRRQPFTRFKGRHILDRHPDGLEKCIGCELCAGACPADAILVIGADNQPDDRRSPGERYAAVYEINYLRCIFCGLCVEACPTEALVMSNSYDLSDDSRTGLIFTKEQLLVDAVMQTRPTKDLIGQGQDVGEFKDFKFARALARGETIPFDDDGAQPYDINEDG